jgi:hypothetical protein
MTSPVADARPASLTIDWGEHGEEEARRREWMASWLVSADGEEGDFFYEGQGGTVTTHEVPANAVGLRFRWYPPGDSSVRAFQRTPIMMRRLYLFEEHPESMVNALDWCRG